MKAATTAPQDLTKLAQHRIDEDEETPYVLLGDGIKPNSDNCGKQRSRSAHLSGSKEKRSEAGLAAAQEKRNAEKLTRPSNWAWFQRKFTKGLKKRVPVLGWLPSYNPREDLISDIIGGATIGMVCLAQTLAHAAIATTKPIQGPYCAFMPAFVYALMGTSPHASVSSGAIAAIIIADQLKPWDDIEDRTQMASLLALVSGCTLVIIGVCKLSFAVRFLSQPTIGGFVTGGSMLIILQQFKNLCGFTDFPHTDHIFHLIEALIMYIPKIDPKSLILGIFLMLVLEFFTRVKKRCEQELKKKSPPAWAWGLKRLCEMKEIVVTLIGAAFGYLTRDEDGNPILAAVGHIPAGLPPYRAPWDIPAFPALYADREKFNSFVVGGSLVAFTTFLTTYATAKKMAIKYGYPLDATQEMIGLGSAGIAGSFFGAFPPSGSLSRTGLAADCGVKTQLGGVFCAGIIGLGLMYLTPALAFLPKTTLAAIIITSTRGLMDFGTPRRLMKFWRPMAKGGLKRDLIIWCLAFFFTTCLGVLEGILIAVVVSVVLIVADAAAPQAVVLGRVEMLGRRWRNLSDWPQAVTFPGIMVFEFRGPLSFASAEWFEEQLEKKRVQEEQRTGVKTRVVVLSLGSVHLLDDTALFILKELLIEWKKNGILCIFSGAKHQVRTLIEEVLDKREKLTDQTAFMISINDAVEIANRRLKALDEKVTSNGMKAQDDEKSIEKAKSARKIQRAIRDRRSSLILAEQRKLPESKYKMQDLGKRALSTIF